MSEKSAFEPDADGSPASGMRRGLTSYGDTGFSLFLRKAFIKGAGYTDAALDRPVIGIANTGSAYNPCHGNAPQLIEAVQRGVMLAGGLPMAFPTISVHESFAAPTSMYLRNLMAMDTEEMVRAQPMDAVVLIGGCDKTVPAQLMGAASAGLPSIQLITGSMLTGSHRGERVGACTDCRRYWARFRAGEIDAAETAEVNHQLVASVGTCSVMGTASTMACIAEALGMTVPGGASPPAVTADRIRIAEQTGARAVQMARERLTIDRVLTPAAFENAMRVLLAIGGSTNGIVHLAAIAGRMGLDIDLATLDRMGRETPVLLDLKPSGQHYMEDFHKAGGMATLLRELKPLLRLDALTVTGRTLGEELEAAGPGFAQDVVRTIADPIYPQGGIAVLRGNLAPGGAIIKQSAADPELMEHEGRAVVFENVEDLARRIDRDDLDVKSDDVLVLKNIGPKGAPGMPEAGYLPIPRKLARAGVKDMVRISDGRMSGTAFGTIVLHVTPESAIGGPLAHVRNGDRIRLSVTQRELTLRVPPQELARRAAEQPVVVPSAERGYLKLFLETVTQADQGVDFDFLRAPPRQRPDAALGGLDAAEPLQRASALQALVVAGRASTPLLLHALTHADAAVREKAAQGLAEIADPSAAGALRAALADADPLVRGRAAQGLAAIGVPDALQALAQTLDDHPDATHPLHTVATYVLIARGVDSLPVIAPLLDAPAQLTRQRAFAVLEAVAPSVHGVADWRGLWRRLGAYDPASTDAAARGSAAAQWRDWIAAHAPPPSDAATAATADQSASSSRIGQSGRASP